MDRTLVTINFLGQFGTRGYLHIVLLGLLVVTHVCLSVKWILRPVLVHCVLLSACKGVKVLLAHF